MSKARSVDLRERAVAPRCVLAQPSTRQLNVLVLRGQRQPLAEWSARRVMCDRKRSAST